MEKRTRSNSTLQINGQQHPPNLSLLRTGTHSHENVVKTKVAKPLQLVGTLSHRYLVLDTTLLMDGGG
jgi:hypothetical protein